MDKPNEMTLADDGRTLRVNAAKDRNKSPFPTLTKS